MARKETYKPFTKWLAEVALGEPIEAIVFEKSDWLYPTKTYVPAPIGVVMTYVQALPTLKQTVRKWEDRWTEPNQNFTAWTASYVIVVREYDCRYWLERVPRHPNTKL